MVVCFMVGFMLVYSFWRFWVWIIFLKVENVFLYLGIFLLKSLFWVCILILIRFVGVVMVFLMVFVKEMFYYLLVGWYRNIVYILLGVFFVVNFKNNKVIL